MKGEVVWRINKESRGDGIKPGEKVPDKRFLKKGPITWKCPICEIELQETNHWTVTAHLSKEHREEMAERMEKKGKKDP
jgi:hypothetical protein